MTAMRKIGTNYQEALNGLASQFRKHYRETGRTDYQVDCYLIQDGQFICLCYTFQLEGEHGWVPLELTGEPWSEERRQRLIRDARHVLDKALSLETFAAQYVAAKVWEVARAYH